MTTINIPAHPLATEPVESRIMRPDEIVMLLEQAGVELGDFDREIARWLPIWDRSAVITLLSWIRRAAHRPAVADTGAARRN